jgi:hypothetical protein
MDVLSHFHLLKRPGKKEIPLLSQKETRTQKSLEPQNRHSSQKGNANRATKPQVQMNVTLLKIEHASFMTIIT